MTLRIEFGRAGDRAGDEGRSLPDDAADLQVAKDFVTAAKHFGVFAVELVLWGDEELEDDPDDDEGETVAFLGIASGILLSWYFVGVDSAAAELVRAALNPMHALSDSFRTMPQSARGTVLEVGGVEALALDLIQTNVWDLRRDVAAIKTRLECAEEDEEDEEDDEDDEDWKG